MTTDAIIDLYHGNQVDDWAMVRASGIVGVMLKCSQGSSFIDPSFVRRVDEARAAGLLVGAYHFCDDRSAGAQLELLLRVLRGLGPLLVALDVEPNGPHTVVIPQVADLVHLFMRTLGSYPVLYMGRYGPDGHGDGLPNITLMNCPLWIPAYGTRFAFLNQILARVGMLPRLPMGWGSYELWQYTDRGAVPGIPGAVDRSRFNGDEAELRARWAANAVSV